MTPAFAEAEKKFKKCCMAQAIVADRAIKRLAVIRPILQARDENAAEFRAIQRKQLLYAGIAAAVIIMAVAVYFIVR